MIPIVENFALDFTAETVVLDEVGEAIELFPAYWTVPWIRRGHDDDDDG